jgi:hypothetical protein
MGWILWVSIITCSDIAASTHTNWIYFLLERIGNLIKDRIVVRYVNDFGEDEAGNVVEYFVQTLII